MSAATVLSNFEAHVAATPAKTAVFWGGEHISYRDLAQRIDRLAAHLAVEYDIKKGALVGILLKNSPQYIEALFAVLKLGGTVVPVNTFFKAPEIQHIVDDCELKHLISSNDFEEITCKLQNLNLINLSTLSISRHTNFTEAASVSLNDLALIIYTSGTTGKPKGAMLTHGNIAANVRSCAAVLEETSSDRLTLFLPMFHSFMLTVCIFVPLSLGAGIVLIKSVHPFRTALREMIRHRATIFIAIPQVYQALADANIPFWLRWLLKFRMAVSGAAPLPQETLRQFEEKMRFPILEGYGLSEASPVVSFNPCHGVRKPGSVGLPLPGIAVKIFDDGDHELPSGQVGEIVIQGPNVMLGYYNHPEETAEVLRNGWLHTGDMGKKDDDGYIFIVDRRKEMLLVRGLNVYPREIEEVLYQFPNIREAAVVGTMHEKRGECPIAFVSAKEGETLNPNEIKVFCRERLADYKVPHEVRILENLPRTPTGKIAKLELKKLL
jgi:long-chain acyl-CoA synthetase